MPFCPNCGRPLNENEICHCTPQSQTPQPPYPQQGQPYAYNYQQPYPAPQPLKKKSGCLIAGIVCGIIVLMFLLLILAAIFIPAMIGYTHKARKSEANTAARRYGDAVAVALAELYSCDCEDIDIHGTYIICSDINANVNVPFEILSDFYDTIDHYAAVEDTYEYFVVVEDGSCVYTAVHNIQNNIIGTYPASGETLMVRRYSGTEADSNWTISELYTDACTDLYSTYN